MATVLHTFNLDCLWIKFGFKTCSELPKLVKIYLLLSCVCIRWS